MAERPVFIPKVAGNLLVDTKMVAFTWSPGLSVQQKQKSIAALHMAAEEDKTITTLLEISTKSPNNLGVSLSAFNLMYASDTGKTYSLETMFQAAKVFKNGGPYRDLLHRSPRDAKRDPRLKESGPMIEFTSSGVKWPLEPKTAFYDWLYLNVLEKQPELAERLLKFDGFTDIEFNPKKSINCQAYSAALYVSLRQRGLLDKSLESRDIFLKTIGEFVEGSTVGETPQSGSLL